jgi:hypothetical protein
MKKVRILQNVPGVFGGETFFYQKGDVHDLPDALADDLIRGGHAEILAAPKPEILAEKAVSKAVQKGEKR